MTAKYRIRTPRSAKQLWANTLHIPAPDFGVSLSAPAARPFYP
jgi:hypothetical protein